MNKNLIAEIFVPLNGCAEGQIATGYPIARNLVLTARHPLFPDDPGRNDQGCDRPGCRVEVRWRCAGVDVDHWWPVRGIAWESERWDLALLECDFPPGVSAWGLLSAQKPRDDMEWVSAGFPVAGGEKKGVRQPFQMKGGVFSMLDTDDTFALEAAAGPQDEHDWKGASGSPVVVNWRILGVVVSVPDKVGAARLWAVPIWRLLQEKTEEAEAFRRVVRYEDGRARCDRISGRVRAALEGAPEAVDALIGRLPGATKQTVHQSTSAKAAFLAKRLLDENVESLVNACRAAHREVEVSRTDAEALEEIVQAVLPSIYDHGVVEAVRNLRGDTTASLVTVPAYFPTIAEIIMAGVDRRGTRFCPRKRDDDFPKGRLNLPEPPEGGFDPDGERAAAALSRHLSGKFSPRAGDELAKQVDDFLIHSFYSPRPGAPERDPRQKIESVAEELRYRSEEEGLTHYLILPYCEDDESRRVLENTVQRIRESYPSLVCLSLATDYALEKEERRCYRPLLPLLPKTATTP